jgi:demethylmenaquinone methyltransferase/2-methoxy-6-polyprenyl-1,4-benzoquinol methylase
VADPPATLRELARPLRSGGTLASLEFHVPPNRFWRAWWWAYTRGVLPLAGRLLGGRPWQEVGHFLGPSISGHYREHPVSTTGDAWRGAGLRDVGVRLMSLGGGLVMWGRKA